MTLSDGLVPALCALARRYLAASEAEFAEAVTVGDDERAGRVAAEAFELSAALKRQEGQP